ncbi:hypothetical protein SASPL_157581 [Salvia splendens]|uniref:Uncharacterized protein n=1 Tax=Salvia splendens TaxID=180675 RepID=A0A8X8YUQ8_SALSN|nr:hypothetical protein SASPL_157581 [Salvia splendens]
MEPAVRRRGGGAWEGMYRLVMRRTPVYVTFVLVGAFVGERVCRRSWNSRSMGTHQRWGFSSLHSHNILLRNAMRIFRFWDRDSPKSEVTAMNNLPWHPFLSIA